jgi:multidrug efflux system membrane fusion protein
VRKILHSARLLLGISLFAVAGLGAASSAYAQGTLRIAQAHSVFIAFSLPIELLPQLRASLEESSLQVTAQDSDGKSRVIGKLVVIDNRFDPATGTISVKAVFDNTDETWLPGQFVNIRVLGHNALGQVTP